MTSAAKIATVQAYLRRKYADNVDGLKALADQVATEATSAVTITGSSYEGASDTGVLTFEPIAYLAALEGLIAEMDPDSPQPAPSSVESDFSYRNALS